MVEEKKLLYILVEDEELGQNGAGGKAASHRYTRPILQSTLQFMGCRPRHAFKISDNVFELVRNELPPKKQKRQFDQSIGLVPLATEVPKREKLYDTHGFKVHPKPLKKRSTAIISREKFLDVVCDALAQYRYLGLKQRSDLMVACRIRERKESVTVLLCGTSGCGKSTLASLLAHRLGVTTVVSTDSVRHMMRGFVSEEENPLLWASTYHAGEFLDQEAVAQAKSKRKEAKQASLPIRSSSSGSYGTLTPAASLDRKSLVQSDSELKHSNGNNGHGVVNNGKTVNLEEMNSLKAEGGSCKVEVAADSLVGAKTMAIQGFKAQSEMVMESLDRLITAWEAKKESVVVEGVHLSLNFVMGLMKKHPSIIPFLVYIANEDKHMERFAVRAKYMTLDPAKNKYVKYFRNIRMIQDYLCKRADKHLVPKVNNTNVDKSVAAIHATVFSCLRRRADGEALLDQATNTVKVVHQEYMKQYTSSALGSKGMFQLIQRKGSSRNLMALLDTDGTVTKAWPLSTMQLEKKPSADVVADKLDMSLYGPLSIGRAEPVHLQFGNRGLGAWPSDQEDLNENGSSSFRGSGNTDHLCYGSPTPSVGPGSEKELVEEVEVSGSEEEIEDEQEETEDGGQSSGSELEPVEEDDMEGSVDDESVRSDGDVDYVETSAEGDDAYWEDDESPMPPQIFVGESGKVKKANIARLLSFDQATAAGRVQPQLRRSFSHKGSSRLPSRTITKSTE